MKTKAELAVEQYQCPGCVVGSDISCFGKHTFGKGCGKHVAGTIGYPVVGKFFLGMPTGFCRLGSFQDMKLIIYETWEELSASHSYDKLNAPVWKYVNESGHTLVRGLYPRTNFTFLHVILEDCSSKIDCIEITNKDLEGMD